MTREGPETQLQYLYLSLYIYTYIHERGWVCSKVTHETESQGKRCLGWRAMAPHSEHSGRKGASSEAWGRQSPSQLLQYQEKAGEGRTKSPDPLTAVPGTVLGTPEPCPLQPSSVGHCVARDIAPIVQPEAHATGRACWAFTW